MEVKLFSLEAWTISVWADEQALNTFVREMPHLRAMQALVPHMGKTQFAQWSVSNVEIPLDWTSAKARIKQT